MPTCQDVLWYGMGVCLSTKLVNMIQTEPFQYYHHTLYMYILLMTRGRHLLIFKVRGQRSRSTHYTLLLNLVNTIQTEMFQL